MKINASIIGASGYTGIELARLLLTHPDVNLKHLVSHTYQGQNIAQVFPHLANMCTADFSEPDYEKVAGDSDVIFLALPHGKAAPLATKFIETGCKVIDLSPDLRIKDPQTYEKWYSHPAPATGLIAEAVYGLPEIGLRGKIAQAKLIANPGCYPTATILGLAPLISGNLLQQNGNPLIIDAKSGISGAGRNLKLDTHFCEAFDNYSAYQIGGVHRHIPEIEQELNYLAKGQQELSIVFTPQIIPVPRGIMATIYCKWNQDPFDSREILKLYRKYYHDSHFIRILEHDHRPGIKSVVGSNFCNIGIYHDSRTGYLVIISMIDNLLKGASGQAIQNMNLMYQLPESTGLTMLGSYP